MSERQKNKKLPNHRLIAVVGLGLSLPGASTEEEFWANILEGRQFLQQATTLDWGAEPESFYKPGPPAAVDKAYSLNGGFNQDRTIDPQNFNLPPNFDAKSADGSLAFWLNAGRAATSDLKLDLLDPEKVGVIAGHVILPSTAMAEAVVSLYTKEATRSWKNKPLLDPPPKNAFCLAGYSARLLAEALGFKGPAFTLDAACASSLYAIHLAVEELLSGRLDAVISGGVAKADALFTQLGFSQLRALSPSGAINPFDQRADGLVVGEGAVALVLKRLDTALAHGDRIRALISGVGLSNDQTGNILAPQAEGQLRAMKSAWHKCELKPWQVDLIEAHGTGTILGDKTEVGALKELLVDPEFQPQPRSFPAVIGSVKNNIGHLLSAAGAASLAKVILALEHKILPPMADFQKEAEGLDLAQSPALKVLTKPEPWPEQEGGSPRVAMVNAFGFGGVNAQVIVEEFLVEKYSASSRPKSAESKVGARNQLSPVRLLAARALSAPWPDFASLAQNWMDSEGPPIISTRRFGTLRATGLFFNNLVMEGASLRLAPKDLAHILPQQALALKIAEEALSSAHLKAVFGHDKIMPENGELSENLGVDKKRVGVFMGVDIDPRSADYAYRWLAPLRTAEALVARGQLKRRDIPEFVAALRKFSHPPLAASRVVGALGSLVASRVARYLGTGGPAYTVTDGKTSGLRVLKIAMEAINQGEIDLAFVGLVDTMGDPKTAAMEPQYLWEEGAAMLILASEEAAALLGRAEAPELSAEAETVGRLSSLGGLFPLVKNAFFINHRLVSRGLGAGAAYWIKNKCDPPRRLEAAGFAITEKGGEEVSSPPYSYEESTWFLVRARHRTDALELLQRLEMMAKEAQEDQRLVDVLGAFRAEKRALKDLGDRFWAEYGELPEARPTLAILAKGFDDLHQLLVKARAHLRGETQVPNPELKGRIIWGMEGERLKGELAWVFPGSGSHYQGLGRRLAMNFPHLMGKLEDGVSRLADQFQSSVFWGPQPKEATPLQAILAQVSFGLLGAQVLEQFKVTPDAVLGYSLGETTSLLATGAWTDRESLYGDLVDSPLFTKDLASNFRAAKEYFNIPKSKHFRWVMGVLAKPANEIYYALLKLPQPYRDQVFLSIINSPTEGIVGGEEAAVDALSQALGIPFVPLEGVAAVHNPSVSLVQADYERFHTRATVPAPGVRYYSTAWAKAYTPTTELAAKSLTEQALRGFNFVRLIRQAYQDGVRFFVDMGPGSSMTRLINNILGDRPHLAASLSPSPQEEGWVGLHRLLVELWMAGYPLKMSVLYPDAKEANMVLPVPIALEPLTNLWPEPEEILENLTAEPQPNQMEVSAVPPATSAPLATPSSSVHEADSAQSNSSAEFKAWLAETTAQRKENEAALKADSPAPLNRSQCLEFAVGQIGKVFGDRFVEVDSFPSRVRLPAEPLMLVDRVLALEGKALSLGPGRIVTEHDVLPKAWYLDQGHIPVGLAIESGQADLMLSAWAGIDFTTRGLALYRLLDAEVTFHRELPKIGETARYDIKILRFFKYGQTNLFRFEFQGTVNGAPLLTMKGGCAGFFTPAELAGGRGLPGGGLTDEPSPAFVAPELKDLRQSPARSLPASLSGEALAALRAGDLVRGLGQDFTPNLKKPVPLPGGQMTLLSRVTKMERHGGRYGAGFIRSEMDIDPKAWFLTSHFVGDEVMPGTLMYESCLHTLRVFLMASGWVGEEGEVSWQPALGRSATLKCRGQVTPQTKMAAYEIHVRRLEFQDGEPVAEAEAIMLADNRPVVEVRGLNLRLAGASLEMLKSIWPLRSKVVAAKPIARTADNYFTKDKLLAFAQGAPSEALGPQYARFDEGDFVARLPRPPYDFIDEATVTVGSRYKVEPGSIVKAVWTPPADSWLFQSAGGEAPSLPYAALNEVALQPCGFLAAFMGSALPFTHPMHFRNLGGEATVLGAIYGGERVETTASLMRSSRMGDMLIQHYQFNCRAEGRAIYEGQTQFGFFSSDSLARQAGLGGLDLAKWPTRPADFESYPQGEQWPSGLWPMVERLAIDLSGGPQALGTAFAATAVDPKAWFFDAHFYQDPVWPGSLGLEAFLQVLKVIWSKRFGDEPARWASPAVGLAHNWLYRGQITPQNKEMSLSVVVKKVDNVKRTLEADGLLLVDNLPIYQMNGFRLGLAPKGMSGFAQPQRRVVDSKKGQAQQPTTSGREKARSEHVTTPEQLLAWRREKGLSQGQLAQLMGVTPIYVSLMERGKRNISALMAEKLSLIFSTPDDERLDSKVLAKGTLKTRREEKAVAAELLTPERLRNLRQEKGLSQKKLADQVGVTATLIGLIELDKRGLSLDLAKKLLAVLEGN